MFNHNTRLRSPRWPNAHKTNRFLRCGAATVEMAFVAPFVFLLIFSSIEFARMMMVRQAVTNAAREGCRHAALITTQNQTDADAVIRDMLRGVIQNVDDSDKLRVQITPEFTASPASGTRITASVDVDCADVSWLPPLFYAGARIGGTASMNRE